MVRGGYKKWRDVILGGGDEMGNRAYASRYMNDLNHASSDSFAKMPKTPPMSGSPDMPT
jgi:hypothetical protein